MGVPVAGRLRSVRDDPIESSRPLFLVMVALLPLHTVNVQAWVAWKPWLVLSLVIAGLHIVAGTRDREWPWHPVLTVGAVSLIAAAAASWSGDTPQRFVRLLLALGVASVVMLVTERLMHRPGMMDRVLRVVFWSAAAMAATVLPLAVLSTGVFGAAPLDFINDIPGIELVAKNVYLEEGMVAVTNWHVDPGYAAAWTNLWAALALLASQRGLGSGRRLVDAAVIGSLWLGVLLTYSRTGVGTLVIATAIVLWHERRQGRLRSAARLAGRAALITIALVAALLIIDPSGEGGDVSRGFTFRLGQGLSLGEGTLDSEGTALFDNRRQVWSMYIEFFRDDPLRGVGLGTGWANTIQEPHSLPLELLGEMGLIGLAGFTVLAVSVGLNAGGGIGLVALAVALTPSLTQTILFEPTAWFAAGLAVGTAAPRRARGGVSALVRRVRSITGASP